MTTRILDDSYADKLIAEVWVLISTKTTCFKPLAGSCQHCINFVDLCTLLGLKGDEFLIHISIFPIWKLQDENGNTVVVDSKWYSSHEPTWDQFSGYANGNCSFEVTLTPHDTTFTVEILPGKLIKTFSKCNIFTRYSFPWLITFD